jgi:hypothetical protein
MRATPHGVRPIAVKARLRATRFICTRPCCAGPRLQPVVCDCVGRWLNCCWAHCTRHDRARETKSRARGARMRLSAERVRLGAERSSIRRTYVGGDTPLARTGAEARASERAHAARHGDDYDDRLRDANRDERRRRCGRHVAARSTSPSVRPSARQLAASDHQGQPAARNGEARKQTRRDANKQTRVNTRERARGATWCDGCAADRCAQRLTAARSRRPSRRRPPRPRLRTRCNRRGC